MKLVIPIALLLGGCATIPPCVLPDCQPWFCEDYEAERERVPSDCKPEGETK